MRVLSGKKYKVYCIANSHIDVSWLWRKEETLRVCSRTFTYALNLIDKYSIVFAQSNIVFYEWMEKYFPKIFRRIKKLVRGGKWEIVGGSWVECDTNMPLGESLIRQFLYGITYVRKKFGVDIKIAWFPDSFGFPISLPKILRHVGIKFFLTSKLRWNDTTEFPYYLFLWRSDDDSEVLAYQSVGAYDEKFDVKKVKEYLSRIYKRHKIHRLLFLYGKGDHGGGPTEEDIKNMKKNINNIDLIVAKSEQFFCDVYEDIKSNRLSLPSLKDELYLQFHRGVYTTQRIVKKLMRLCETSIMDTEFLIVLSQVYGLTCEKIDLKSLWKVILTNQFHDILSGTLSKDATFEAISELKKVLVEIERAKTRIIRKIVNHFHRDGEDCILAINPTSWPRNLIITTPDKRELGKILDVPSFGVKIVPIKKIGRRGVVKVVNRRRFIVLENHKYRLFIDKKTGLLSQIFDKVLGERLLRAPIKIRIYDDHPSWKRKNLAGYPAAIFDSWEVFIFDNNKYLDIVTPLKVFIEENNSLRASATAIYKFRQGLSKAIFKISYKLDDTSDAIEIEIKALWQSKHKLAKIIIPLNTDTEYAIYGAPYGVIKRIDYSSKHASKAERAKYEVPTIGWIQIPNKTWSISVAVDSSVGVSKDKSDLEITLLKSSTYPSIEKFRIIALIPKQLRDRVVRKKKILCFLDSMLTIVEPMIRNYMDQGRHRIRIKIKSHHGTEHVEALKLWSELNRKCYVVRIKGEEYSGKIVEINPSNVIISSIKPAEENDGIILRLWNLGNSDEEVKITLHDARIREAYSCNGLEDIIEKLETSNTEIKIGMKGNQIRTIKIYPEIERDF